MKNAVENAFVSQYNPLHFRSLKTIEQNPSEASSASQNGFLVDFPFTAFFDNVEGGLKKGVNRDGNKERF
ncbi:hypothetical protein [Candidatus Methylacidiphilum infernorum]|uniref:hypothetical protein n=1 Tax=Candidatus Methylacidiphilum infernorum TaxID=511746 RepID=UPI0002DA9C4B|nr:hypothetical protein [Candidatus Methylacidiphilum infernorum]